MVHVPSSSYFMSVSPFCIIRIVYVQVELSSLLLDTNASVGFDWVASLYEAMTTGKCDDQKQSEIRRVAQYDMGTRGWRVHIQRVVVRKLRSSLG